jgi:hypothetical protein
MKKLRQIVELAKYEDEPGELPMLSHHENAYNYVDGVHNAINGHSVEDHVIPQKDRAFYQKLEKRCKRFKDPFTSGWNHGMRWHRHYDESGQAPEPKMEDHTLLNDDIFDRHYAVKQLRSMIGKNIKGPKE